VNVIQSFVAFFLLVVCANAQTPQFKTAYLTNSCFYSSSGMLGFSMPRMFRSKFDDKLFEKLKSDAESGSATANNELGLYYFTDSESGNKDVSSSLKKQAFECFKVAGEKGLLVGNYNLANCYEYGIGIEKNIEEATRLFQKLKDMGCNFLMPERVAGKKSSTNPQQNQ